MVETSKLRCAAITAILLAGIPLSAQRYQGRDHHVYHPPAQKQSATAGTTHPKTGATATVAGAHSSSQGPLAAPVSTGPKPPLAGITPGDRQPQ